ncbi:hypothetical protein LEN26_015130 [Aphanomyces euteiches]|nr:hypothetical protein LEN26_015130 [Aphanomyces euteiches]KAH9124646.1 hypothetical protein AeMF1_004628 [Aphanomyces euteiches]KAH9194313.1 hypothetical protein AeNC1_003701 [Aphanomyces euteiches]
MALQPPASLYYGQHFPHGIAAFAYLTGRQGTWRSIHSIKYEEEYYTSAQFATPCPPLAGHPTDVAKLLEKASVSPNDQIHTARDSNCLLLSDFGNRWSVNQPPRGQHVFVEHVGANKCGVQTNDPLFLAWLDDNWAARNMMQAYNAPLPWGLHASTTPSRRTVLDGGTFDPCPNASTTSFIDRIAQHALYQANTGDWNGVLSSFDHMLSIAKPSFNHTMHWFDNTDVDDVYHLALMKIVGQRLLDDNSRASHRVLEHVRALHGNLLTMQGRNATGGLIGWTTSVKNVKSLINTETTALAVLALCAGAQFCFEASAPPMKPARGFFVRPYAVVSAVVGRSPAGHRMVFGPNVRLPTGEFVVSFNLRMNSSRVPNEDQFVGTVDVFDGVSVLASMDFHSSENEWSLVNLGVSVTRQDNSMEFRVWWHGTTALNVGAITVAAKKNSQQDAIQSTDFNQVQAAEDYSRTRWDFALRHV